MYYLFIDEHRIEPYNGEILKRFVGNKLVKAISNPTNEDLEEFMYMELVTANPEDIPEYDTKTQSLEVSYYIKDNKIYETYTVVDDMPFIEPEEEIVEEVIKPEETIETVEDEEVVEPETVTE